MDERRNSQHQKLVETLVKGRDAATQFQLQLQRGQAASQELKGHLVETIVSSFTTSFSLVQNADTFDKSQQPSMALYDSSCPPGNNPTSDNSDEALREAGMVDMSTKKRWREEVRVSNGTSSEGQLKDGHYWRKYGQKDIQGSRFPRSYYRCAHKSQGCPATKQVQRSDKDPTIFEVIYKGTHTCQLSTTAATAIATASTHKNLNNDMPSPINVQAGLKVKKYDHPDLHPPLFPLPPSLGLSTNSLTFTRSPEMVTPIINTASALVYPATAMTNYPCPVRWAGHGLEYEHADTFTQPQSSTSSGMMNLELEFPENPVDHIESNDFPFDAFFS